MSRKKVTRDELKKEIEKRKRKLIKTARKDGFYENFGLKEQREIERVELDSCSPNDLRVKDSMITRFDAWRGLFDLTDLRNKSDKEIMEKYPYDKELVGGV